MARKYFTLQALLVALFVVAFTNNARSQEAIVGPSETLTSEEVEAYAKTFHPTGIRSSEFAAVRVVRDLVYARYGDEALMLDMYLPAEADNSTATIEGLPCVIAVTGGGFRARDKEHFGKYAAFLATKGFASASITYRGTPDHQFLATIHDCKAAVRYVRANAKRFDINPSQIGILGQSAGGHLAGMLAVSGDVAAFEGEGGNADVSSRVQAAVSFAGVFDFISRLREGGHQKTSNEKKKETNGEWIGEPFSIDSENWKLASPISHLSHDDAPLLLGHTETDKVVPIEQSIQMHEAMQRMGLESELMTFETGGHSVSSSPAINQQVWSQTIDFLEKHLSENNQ